MVLLRYLKTFITFQALLLPNTCILLTCERARLQQELVPGLPVLPSEVEWKQRDSDVEGAAGLHLAAVGLHDVAGRRCCLQLEEQRHGRRRVLERDGKLLLWNVAISEFVKTRLKSRSRK